MAAGDTIKRPHPRASPSRRRRRRDHARRRPSCSELRPSGPTTRPSVGFPVPNPLPFEIWRGERGHGEAVARGQLSQDDDDRTCADRKLSSPPTAKATDENLTSEDWGAIIELCDRVTGDQQNGPKEAVQSMIKRLAHRNANVQLYTLAVSFPSPSLLLPLHTVQAASSLSR